MKSKKLMILALLVAAPTLTFAQAGKTGMTYEQFNYLDKDGNGSISEVEYFQFMEGAFDELDTDRNNALSDTETTNILSADQFNKVDLDGDGQLSRQEFLGHVISEFHYHDANKDGGLQH